MIAGTVTVRPRPHGLAAILGAAVLALGVSTTRADDTAYSPDIVVLDVTDTLGRHGVFTVPFSAGTYTALDRSIAWSVSTAFDVLDTATSQVVATVRSASLQARVYPPKIYLNLTIDAGSAACTVKMKSPFMQTPFIPAAASQIKSFASFTLRDQGTDGATLTGVGAPGAGAFRAVRNGEWPGGILMSQLVATVTAGSGATGSAFQNDPSTGYRHIFGTVSSVSTSYLFNLSAGDRATCSSRFDMTGLDFPVGDVNCDGRVNSFDIDPFVLALLDPVAYTATYPSCFLQNADCNFDGAVNNFDVDALLILLGIGAPPP